MKLRIIEAGWINFSGDFGGVEFIDNVSVEDVTPLQARRLANAIQVETLEGKNPSSSQMSLDAQSMPMVVTGQLASTSDGKAEKTATSSDIKLLTRAELEAVADAKGIEGLREIAKPFGISSRSIVGLIDSLINQQGGEPKPGSTEVVPQGLKGSRKQPASFEVEGKTVHIDSVVLLAFEDFEREGKTTDEWNELPEELRETLIENQVAAMRV